MKAKSSPRRIGPFSNFAKSLILFSVWIGATDSIKAADEGPLFLEGIVVEKVKEDSTLGKAGLEAGDLALAWKLSQVIPEETSTDAQLPVIPSEGQIKSAFDWLWLEVELAPRGPMKVLGERDGEPRVWIVEPGLWKAKVRPTLSPVEQEAYLEGKKLIEDGDLESGIAKWSAVATRTQETDADLSGWLQVRIAEVWSEEKLWERALAMYQLALESVREPNSQIAILDAIGKVYEHQNDFSEAKTNYRLALELRRKLWGECLGSAVSLKRLGDMAVKKGDLEQAEDYFRQVLGIREQWIPESLAVAEVLGSLGIVAYSRGALEQAREFHQRALKIRETLAAGSLAMATTLNNLGLVAVKRGDLDQAKELLARSLEIKEKIHPRGLGTAKSLGNLGTLWARSREFDRAEEYHLRALEIRESQAPVSLDVASSLSHLGNIAIQRHDLDRAEDYHQRALEIQEAVAPRSLRVARTLNNLGVVAGSRGDLDRAEEYCQRALEIQEVVTPRSLSTAASLSNLGDVSGNRGDLDRAEAYHRQALDIREALAPGNLVVARSLNKLGNIARQRHDLDRAEAYQQRALEIQEALAPGSLDVAHTLGSLGNIATKRKDLDRAKTHYQRAHRIQEALAPGSLDVAVSLNNLGNVLQESGELRPAAKYFQRALDIKERQAPGSLSVALTLSNLGNVVWGNGHLDQAAEYFQRALEIEEKLAPGGINIALSLNESGNLARQRGELTQARAYFDRSMAALENQVGKLGGSQDVRGRFRAGYWKIYRDAVDLYLELDRPEDAFNLLERSRAKAFLAMLAERGLDFSMDVPEELDRTRRRLATLHDRTLHQMMGLSSTQDLDKIEHLKKELQGLRWQYEETMDAIRRSSPQLAALQDPQPLDLQGIRDALDPGTVLLSYHVGEERSDLFVLTRGEALEVLSLPGVESLRNDIQLLRNLIQDHSLRPYRRARLVDLSHQLYKTLIEPANASIEASERVLIVPDGPLHLLPFGALVRDPGAAEGTLGQFLVEWKPLHFVLSGTVYAELRTRHRRAEPGQQVALRVFGNPHYSRHSGPPMADARVRSAVERNLFAFRPLPYSRWEVEQISKLYPDTTQTYLGQQATEERAKSLGVEPRIVHFATHAYSDDDDPLNSAVALTIPEELTDDRDNGLLQAWEIFESLRLDADLVVLSGCETAIGQNRRGDGLLGLSRAFQYAGARTVAASLWNVSDRATAELMLRFYRRLAVGQAKDEALRGAQLSLIHHPVQAVDRQGRVLKKDFSAPYYWAAFQIYGDWH